MGDDEFYLVKKNNTYGVYKSITDVQGALQSSVNDPSITVLKGKGLSKEAEEYLSRHGLKNAIYTIDSGSVQDDLFGQLNICPFQQPTSSKNKSPSKNHLEKRPLNVAGSDPSAASPPAKLPKMEDCLQVEPVSSYCSSCIIEFDGASKGNPGPAGAGAILRTADGSMEVRLREGVGIATNNVAEYRGVILGLRYALSKGFKHICIKGDSKLVVMQVQGKWKVKHPDMAKLCTVAKELKDQFLSFEIAHVDREFNSAADAQANMGVHLKDGEVRVD